MLEWGAVSCQGGGAVLGCGPCGFTGENASPDENWAIMGSNSMSGTFRRLSDEEFDASFSTKALLLLAVLG